MGDITNTRKLSTNIISRTHCYNNLEISSGTYLGMRNENQDNISIENINNKTIFILCDGHGGNYISKRICNMLLSKFLEGTKLDNIEEIEKVFITIDEYFYKNFYKHKPKREGTTCSILIFDDENIYGINLGDSNYLISKYSESFIGDIHRPNNRVEISRILESGNKIMKVGKDFRINGRLSLSRSFGDFSYKLIDNKYTGINGAVSVSPDFKTYSKDFDFAILASDGFWDFINAKKMLIFIRLNIRTGSCDSIIEGLIKMAINNGSKDNITVILIKFCGK
tara:strand:- start:23 stop:865 length:843 start_codon:yes stop_codon:yes gene_type:complete